MTGRRAKKGIGNEIIFADFPDFRPNLTPREIFQLGAFGGGYYRNIYSTVTKKTYSNQWSEFPDSWWKGLDKKTYLASQTYNKNINRYGVNCGAKLDKNDTFGLQFWEHKGWIEAQDPYGWVQWYCRFYSGRRSPDDERQINRWKGITGISGRFRNQLIGLCSKAGAAYNDETISPVIRQVLLHWGYQLTKRDFNKRVAEKNL